MTTPTLQKIILSRGRADTIITHKILKDYVIVVPDTQLEEYITLNRDIDPSHFIQIPETVHGLGAVRNWVLDNFIADILVMIDDDIKTVINVMRDNMLEEPRKFYDPEVIDQIIWNCAVNAWESGAKLFSFNQTSDKRKFRPEEPFLLKSWVGTITGVIGREIRFTEVNKGKVDIDASLYSLMKHRKVWIDNRFCFLNVRDTNKGGNAEFRNSNTLYQEMKFLKRKWGRYISISRKPKTKERISLRVARKQSISL